MGQLTSPPCPVVREMWGINSLVPWDCAAPNCPHTGRNRSRKLSHSIPYLAQERYRRPQRQMMVAGEFIKQWMGKQHPTSEDWPALDYYRRSREPDHSMASQPTSKQTPWEDTDLPVEAEHRWLSKDQEEAEIHGDGNSPSLSKNSTASGREMPPRETG